jgi:hypothetical protein
MSIRPWRVAPNNLARISLVLLPGGARRGWMVWGSLVIAALLTGAAGSHFYWSQRFGDVQQQAVALKDIQLMQSKLEQSGLLLRVSDARGQELERQIDALNQSLRECHEEVSFFRKARNGNR